MKKGTSFFLLFIAIFVITFFSCKLKIEDSELYDKPGVNLTSKQLTVIIPKVNTDTNYVNVYRRDKANDTIINIGLLYHPLALENDKKNYIYHDENVKKEHSYEYRVRYNIKGNYYLSEWSDAVYIEEDYDFYDDDDTITFSYDTKTDNPYLLFEKTDNTLTIKGNIYAPTFSSYTADGYTPMLIIKSSKATQAFEISSITNDTQIPLIGLLPLSFLDTDLTIEGIVAQKIIYDDPDKAEEDRQIKEVIWTEPSSITIQGVGSSKKIHVTSQTGSDGLDYSRKTN